MLTAEFPYYPKLGTLVATDWDLLHGSPAPKFLPSLRTLTDDTEAVFYLGRGKYYGGIGHDDDGVRVHRGMAAEASRTPTYDLIIVGEVQDFNRTAVLLIERLAQQSSVVIDGDDDQAQYGSLRSASEHYIRAIYRRTASPSHCPTVCVVLA